MIDQIDWAQIEACLAQKTSDWKNREENLQLLIDKLAKNDIHAIEFVTRNSKALALQLNDLRSALVKLASVAVERAAFNAGESKLGMLEKFTDGFLKDANLIKALGSANKVINIHAATAFRSLFEYNQVTLNTLEAFYIVNKDSKNINVRERIAEAFGIYVGNIGKSKERKIKPEGLSFLKKAIETLIKDANGNVRATAKKAKIVLDKIEDAMKINGMSCSMEEESFETRTMSRSREPQKSKTHLTSSLEKSKTIPMPKREPYKGMEIENDETVSLKHFEGSNTKKELKKIKVKTESVIEILESSKKQIKEKVDQISKINLEEFYSNCDCDDYKKLLTQFQYAKNFEFKKMVVKLIEGVKISKFMGNILSYAEKETLDKKLNYSFFITRLLQEELIEFIEYFLFRNNPFSLKLLQKRFDVEEFENIISDNPDLVNSLLTIIHGNVTEGTSENYIKLNVTLLENIFQCSQVVTDQKNYPFSETFYDKLQNLNPDLYKFLQNQKRRLGDKIVFKPNRLKEQTGTSLMKSQISMTTDKRLPSFKPEDKSQNIDPIVQKENAISNHEEPLESKESADTKLEALMSKANTQTKKTVIKSILTHLKNLLANQEPYSTEKIFTKTLEILKYTFEADDLDDEIINLGCKLIEEMYKICEKDQIRCMTLYDIIFDLIRAHPNFKDKIVEFIIGSTIRVRFFTHIMMFVDSKDNDIAVDGLKTLISMLKVGKESYSYMAFHKEVVGLLTDLVKIVKGLFGHAEVGVRKNVVHFVVQCYFFVDKNVFPKMVGEFSAEQQKLVEIYIKKAEN